MKTGSPTPDGAAMNLAYEELVRAGERMVTVARFRDGTEAQFAKGMLESAGVECFLQGEHANAMVPLAFRVRLLVRAVDEADARELLPGEDEFYEQK